MEHIMNEAGVSLLIFILGLMFAALFFGALNILSF